MMKQEFDLMVHLWWLLFLLVVVYSVFTTTTPNYVHVSTAVPLYSSTQEEEPNEEESVKNELSSRIVTYVRMLDTNVVQLTDYNGIKWLTTLLRCRNAYLVVFTHLCMGVLMSTADIEQIPYLRALASGNWKEKPLFWSLSEYKFKLEEDVSEHEKIGACLIECTHPCLTTVVKRYPKRVKIYTHEGDIELVFVDNTE
jgi:hypothetical protein